MITPEGIILEDEVIRYFPYNAVAAAIHRRRDQATPSSQEDHLAEVINIKTYKPVSIFGTRQWRDEIALTSLRVNPAYQPPNNNNL